ncbi:MAG TPA: hypothetical protein VMS16_13675 [Mycobacterium sp.]|nr:hypothetical protein [Mycobacterium sp.]
MLLAGVLCLCAGVASAIFGFWSFTRPSSTDAALVLRRAQAPTQLAAGVMLASGGVVALAAPGTAVLIVVICIAGAVGTVAAGSWQSARFAVRRQAAPIRCAGSCAGCARSCL